MITKKDKWIITGLIIIIMLSQGVSAAVKLDAILKGVLKVPGLTHIMGGVIRDLIYTFFLNDAFFNPIRDTLKEGVFLNILQSNPELISADGGANPIINDRVYFFIDLLVPFYILAFLFLALYIMFISSSPEGRAKAKGSLLRLILSAAFIIFTIPIVQAFLDVSLYITHFVISTNAANIEVALNVLRVSVDHIWNVIFWKMPFFAFWAMMFIFMFGIMLFTIPLVVIGMRYFMIILFTMLFPIGVFLYSIHFTQRLGGKIIKQTVLWIFIQPLMAIILAVFGIASTPLLRLVSDSTMETSLGFAGFMLLGTAPFVMVGLLNWLEMLLVLVEAAMEVPSLHLAGEIEEMELKG